MKSLGSALSVAVLLLLPLPAAAGSPWGAIVKHRKQGQCALAIDAGEGAFAVEGTEGKRLRAIEALARCIESLAEDGTLEDPARALRIGVDAVKSTPRRLVVDAWDDVENAGRMVVERLLVEDLAANADGIVACSGEILRLDPTYAEFRLHHVRASAARGETAEVDTRFVLDHIHDLRPVAQIKPLLTEACATTLARWDDLEDAEGIGKDCVRNLRAQGLTAALQEATAVIDAKSGTSASSE